MQLYHLVQAAVSVVPINALHNYARFQLVHIVVSGSVIWYIEVHYWECPLTVYCIALYYVYT